MPNVTVTPIGRINVRVNQDNQKVVHGTSTFIGSNSEFSEQLNTAISLANTAYSLANTALSTANTKVSKSGDTITGNLTVTGNVTTSVVYAGLIDAGTFL